VESGKLRMSKQHRKTFLSSDVTWEEDSLSWAVLEWSREISGITEAFAVLEGKEKKSETKQKVEAKLSLIKGLQWLFCDVEWK
jgi:hypothetical protein